MARLSLFFVMLFVASAAATIYLADLRGARADTLSISYEKKVDRVTLTRGKDSVVVPRRLLLGHLFLSLRLHGWHFDNRFEAERLATFPNSKKLTIAEVVERRFQEQSIRLKSAFTFLKKNSKFLKKKENAENLETIETKFRELAPSFEAQAAIRPINDALLALLREFVTVTSTSDLDESAMALIFVSYFRASPDLGFVKAGNGKLEFMRAGVTQQQWFDVMGFNPSFFAREEYCEEDFKVQSGVALCPNLPAETMSLYQIEIFMDEIRFRDRFDVSLPSLAERTEVMGVIKESTGWFAENSDMQTHPATSKPANEHGLHDMVGNLWEVLRDDVEPVYVNRPSAPHFDRKFKISGGSWIDRVELIQKKRVPELPDSWICYDVGFRLVRKGL